ncbi:MAG: HypC/HybG/HupF family hydrogenase formation chaperone [Ignavibacteriales bacterium]|nr:HypC/HybG/HupF family hydrogenase formation chaperone [Ignavibacteriales bacterium]
MNLISGELVEIYIAEGTTMGKVRVGGAFMRVPLTFLMETKVGDKILMESGVAISKVEVENLQEQ